MIVIYCSEDGDHSIRHVTKEKFLEDLNKGEYGDGGDNGPKPKFASMSDFEHGRLDLDYFSGWILIDGDVVVPKPVEKVTKFTL